MKKIFTVIFLLTVLMVDAQVAINTTGSNPSSSAMLDVSSSSKGVLISRMTSAQRKAIANPEVGLLVFDLDHVTIYMWDGQQWRPLSYNSEHNQPLAECLPVSTDATLSFGYDVDMSGDYAVTGAPFEDSLGLSDMGAAYVYHRENGVWKLQQKLFPTQLQANERFGARVAIENDLLVVSAPAYKINGQPFVGTVYVYKRNGNTWNFNQQLTLQVVQINADFGCDVAVQNGRILVGAYGLSVNGLSTAGSAFLYEYIGNTWGITKTFKASAPQPNAYYGMSVDLYNDDVVIGATGAVYNGISSGAVYVYTYSPATGNWTEKIFGSSESGMRLGHSVCIYNEDIYSGAPNASADVNGDKIENSGAVIYYKKVNGVWTSGGGSAKSDGSMYGFALAVEGSYFLRGMPEYDATKGLVEGSGIGGVRTYNDIDNLYGTRFGSSVAISGNSFMIGAPGKNNGKGVVMFGVFQ